MQSVTRMRTSPTTRSALHSDKGAEALRCKRCMRRCYACTAPAVHNPDGERYRRSGRSLPLSKPHQGVEHPVHDARASCTAMETVYDNPTDPCRLSDRSLYHTDGLRSEE